MGVGSEVYSAIKAGRKAIGIELKPSYYRQAVKNCAQATADRHEESGELFDALPTP
jgi:DNA modification methylase